MVGIRKKKIIKKNKKRFNPKVFLQKNLRWFLLALIVIIIFHEYIVRLSLAILLGIIGVFTLETTRFVPDISFETITAAAVMFGYLYGWKFAAIFALIFSIIGYIRISKMNQISITMTLFSVLSAVLADLMADLKYPFWISFLVVFFIRGVISYPVMQFINPNPVKNMVHAVGDTIFNMAIVIHFFSLLYDVLVMLNIR